MTDLPNGAGRAAPASRTARQWLQAYGAIAAIVVLSAAINATGLEWGLPGGWAPDEIRPADVVSAYQSGFSGGATIYPPFHYQLLAAVMAPAILSNPAGIDALRDPAFFLVIAYVTRIVSFLMGAGCVLLVFAIGRRLFDARSAAFAALCLAVSPPFVYYSKVANLDVPYLFWFLASVLFFVRALTHERLHDYALLGVTTALAIGTKDQAYGLYVVAPVIVVWWEYRRQRAAGGAATPWRCLINGRTLAALASFVVVFVAVHDMLFDFEGFRSHLEVLLRGPGTGAYQMFERTLSGHLDLMALTPRHLRFSLTLPLLSAAVLGLAWAIRRERPAMPLAVLSFALSYYVTFLSVVLYEYDRFVLPIVALLTVFAGAGLARFVRSGTWARPARLTLVTGLLVFAFARGASVSALMLSDPRYCAETWVQANVNPGAFVMAVGLPGYFPNTRDHELHWVQAERIPTVDLGRADYVLTSSLYGEDRFQEAPDSLERFRVLQRGRGHHRLAAVCRTPTGPHLLDFEGVHSNLDKIGPEIRIYRRTD